MLDIQSSHCSNIFGTMQELVDATNQKYQINQVKQTNHVQYKSIGFRKFLC